MAGLLENVAIIGGGLGGCALALALTTHDIPITIYEARGPDADTLTSGVVLTPNGLHVLDRLGVLDRIKDRCWISTHRTFKDRNDNTVRKVVVAAKELYGYHNHRLWRKVLLNEMKQMLSECGIAINYSSKFAGCESDTHEGATLLINGSLQSASLLIASDGLHSTIRHYLAPGIEPEYTGTLGVLAHIPHSSVSWPYADYEKNATIQDRPGAIFFLPEDAEGKDLMIGLQVQYPEQSREDLERLNGDKDALEGFYRKDYEKWGETARKIIDAVSTEGKQSLWVWPYMRMPKLEKWFSKTGRVVLVGDGAHALPPSSGQGVNQALEDVYSLAMILAAVSKHNGTTSVSQGDGENNGTEPDPSQTRVLEGLGFWQQMRQKRVDAIYDWATNSNNVQRLPEAERNKLVAEGKIKKGTAGEGDDMSWLYAPRLETDVQEWIHASL
ncbi:hypothetical protein LTR78_004476 [Recurvomyces mirabilis]|uniref:FAD-binding domain-containing protein n=1 Tax=Recurvomyces mirabilis TaxID=574656 RepID=A0AAE1C2T9_9PEZI|nr:hypothetical protein LTR78_004476 [Recurvomyces mirabilis]KAK5155858.1 hypothetical protein LTS14_005424 [Recurvomyces mirabilis]